MIQIPSNISAVLLAQNNEIKEDETGEPCNTHERDEKCTQNFSRKAERKLKTRSEDTITSETGNRKQRATDKILTFHVCYNSLY
jgi:hypothetical protein